MTDFFNCNAAAEQNRLTVELIATQWNSYKVNKQWEEAANGEYHPCMTQYTKLLREMLGELEDTAKAIYVRSDGGNNITPEDEQLEAQLTPLSHEIKAELDILREAESKIPMTPKSNVSDGLRSTIRTIHKQFTDPMYKYY